MLQTDLTSQATGLSGAHADPLATGSLSCAQRLPPRLEASGGGAFRRRRALATRRLGDGREERRRDRLARRLLGALDVRSPPPLGGRAPQRLRRPRHGRRRVLRHARRESRRRILEPEGESGHVLHARPAGREFVPLAPQAQRAAPHLPEHLGARPRHRGGQPALAPRALAASPVAPSGPAPLRVPSVRLLPSPALVSLVHPPAYP